MGAAAAVVAWGLAVGAVGLLGCGVAVAEDPQANSSATNNRTIALGRCLITGELNLDFGTGTFLLIRVTVNKSESQVYVAAIRFRTYDWHCVLYVTECKLSIRQE